MGGSPNSVLADIQTVDIELKMVGVAGFRNSYDPCSGIVLDRLLEACPACLNLHLVLGKQTLKCLLFTSIYMFGRAKARLRLLGWSRLLLLLSGIMYDGIFIQHLACSNLFLMLHNSLVVSHDMNWPSVCLICPMFTAAGSAPVPNCCVDAVF